MRSKHSRRNRNRGAHEQREKRQLQRRRIPFENDPSHWRLKFERLPKIAMHQSVKIMTVLHMKWLVQAKRMPQLNNFTGSSTLTKHLFNRVAGNNMNHEKNK